MNRTAGHPNCLRIALVFFVMTFALSVMAFSQELGVRDGGPLAPPAAVRAGGTDPRASQPRPFTGTRSGSKVFAVTTAGYLALSASDFYLSNRCIQAGRCVEVGSYRGVATHPLAFALVKMTASSALAATAWSLRKQHPRAAWGTLIGLTVAQGAVCVWNSQQGVRK